jgi:hypothetical protein
MQAIRSFSVAMAMVGVLLLGGVAMAMDGPTEQAAFFVQ